MKTEGPSHRHEWVVEVGKESPADNPLQSNDVILKINKTPVGNVREMRRTLVRAKNRLVIVISRNQKEREVILNVDPV